MKTVIRSKVAKDEPLEERFHRFAKALMAVPKKELDKELAKHERTKHARKKQGKAL
jgi:hypothetical protein